MYYIKRLTKDLCDQLRIDALISMYGSGDTCDIQNVERTCFASEACAYKFNPSHLDSLLTSTYPYVIVRETSDKGLEFCACVAAERLRNTIPEFEHVAIQNGDIFIHTLCVDAKFRKQGLAKNLLDKLKHMHTNMYLTVAKGTNDHKVDFSLIVHTT